MKKDISYFVACCDVCNKVKAEHQKPAGLLQPLPIPQWKWDEVFMDFVTGLLRTHRCNDAIWIVVDMLTKVAHFIPIRTTYRAYQLAQLCVSRLSVCMECQEQSLQTEVHSLPPHSGHASIKPWGPPSNTAQPITRRQTVRLSE